MLCSIHSVKNRLHNFWGKGFLVKMSRKKSIPFKWKYISKIGKLFFFWRKIYANDKNKRVLVLNIKCLCFQRESWLLNFCICPLCNATNHSYSCVPSMPNFRSDRVWGLNWLPEEYMYVPYLYRHGLNLAYSAILSITKNWLSTPMKFLRCCPSLQGC